jgi:ribosome-associated toxin RatA of RatAB toxin-antitoxin module
VQPWRTSSIALALFTAAQIGAAHAAQDVEIEARRQGDSVEIKAHAQVSAPEALVWQVLTDYEHLPSFIPGIAKSVVRERQGNVLLVEQAGAARFLLFSFPIEVRYEVTEAPQQWVESRAVGGNLRRMNGRYDLEPGSEPLTVRLRYHGLIEPDFRLPPLVGVAAMRSMAEEQFTAMVAEIERRAAAAGARK